MRLTPKFCTLPLLAGLIGSFIACSEGSTTPAGDGDGGTDGTGTGTGGATSTTTTESGGATTTTTTASAGSGATTTTAPGTGGTTATAYTKCFDFAESTELWKKNYASAFVLTDPATRDEVAANALLANTTADWMATAGYGGINGFVQLTIPFATSQTQYQGVLYSYLPATGMALEGKTIRAFVKLVSGMTADDPSKPSGAKLVVKSGADYFYGDGGWVNLGKGEWTQLMLDVNKPFLDENKEPSLYDPNDIREISVEFDTSGSATTVVAPGVVMIDHVCY